MKLKIFLAGAAVALALTSCSSSKSNLTYFNDIRDVKEGVVAKTDYMSPIVPDDELFISVTSTVQGLSAPYNMPLVNPSISSSLGITQSPQQLTYRVDSKGDIDFPILGTIHVAGLTLEQLKVKLTDMIAKEVPEPRVYVSLVNFKVNVAGEVKKPGQIELSGNRCSILDALSAAGDLTEYGERGNILVIREENGEKKYAHINLNSSDLLSSPYYYLRQNDYIYVEPNSILQANSKYNQNNAFKLSVISTIVSAASVIASLVIALTVK